MKNLMRTNVKTYSPVVSNWKQLKSGDTKWEMNENDNSFNEEIMFRKQSQDNLVVKKEKNVNFYLFKKIATVS